jgi:hypothetical protein
MCFCAPALKTSVAMDQGRVLRGLVRKGRLLKGGCGIYTAKSPFNDELLPPKGPEQTGIHVRERVI